MLVIRKIEGCVDSVSSESLEPKSVSGPLLDVAGSSLLNINVFSSPEMSPSLRAFALSSASVSNYAIGDMPSRDSGKLAWACYVMQSNNLNALSRAIPKDVSPELVLSYDNFAQALQAAQNARLSQVRYFLDALKHGADIPELSQERAEYLVYQRSYRSIFCIAKRAAQFGELDFISLCFYQAERCLEACEDVEPAERQEFKDIWRCGHAVACQNKIAQAIESSQRGDVVKTRGLVRESLKHLSKSGGETVCLSEMQKVFYAESNPDSPINKMLNLKSQNRMSLDSIGKTLVYQSLTNEIGCVVDNCSRRFSDIQSAFSRLSQLFLDYKNNSNLVSVAEISPTRDIIVENLCRYVQCIDCDDKTQGDNALEVFSHAKNLFVDEFTGFSSVDPGLLNKQLKQIMSSLYADLKKLQLQMSIDIEQDDDTDTLIEVAPKSRKKLALIVQNLLRMGSSHNDIEYILKIFLTADDFLFREKRKAQTGPNTLLTQMDLPLTCSLLALSKDKRGDVGYRIYGLLGQQDFLCPFKKANIMQHLKVDLRDEKSMPSNDAMQRAYEAVMSYQEKVISGSLAKISEISQVSQSQEGIKKSLKIRHMLVTYLLGHVEKLNDDAIALRKKRMMFKSDLRQEYDAARKMFSLIYRLERCTDAGQFKLSLVQQKLVDDAKAQCSRIFSENIHISKSRGVERVIRKMKFWTHSVKNKGVRFSEKVDVYDIPSRRQMTSLDDMSQDLFKMDEDEMTSRSIQISWDARFFAIKSDMSMLLKSLYEFRLYIWGLNTYYPRESSIVFEEKLDDLVKLGCLKLSCEKFDLAANEAMTNRSKFLVSALNSISCYAELGGFRMPDTKVLLARGYVGSIAEKLYSEQKYVQEKNTNQAKKYRDLAKDKMASYRRANQDFELYD